MRTMLAASYPFAVPPWRLVTVVVCATLFHQMYYDLFRERNAVFRRKSLLCDLFGYICGMLPCQILGRSYLSQFFSALGWSLLQTHLPLVGFPSSVCNRLSAIRLVFTVFSAEDGVVSAFCASITAYRRNCTPRVLPVPSVCFSRKGMGRINKGGVYLRGLQFSEAWSMPSWSWNSV